jgi:hypothetical protein
MFSPMVWKRKKVFFWVEKKRKKEKEMVGAGVVRRVAFGQAK